MILDDMKKKSTSDYTLLEAIIAVMAIGIGVISAILAIVLVIASAAKGSVWILIGAGASAILSMLCFGVIAYVEPDW